jgi:hypothetical protein
MRGGGPRAGLWSEISDFASGTGSERAKVASVGEGTSPRGPRSFHRMHPPSENAQPGLEIATVILPGQRFP